ncbi:MAG: adenosine deaminase [Acidimicrobiales bacterium]
MRDLAALPKGHLHLHLEGGMRPDTLRQLADAYGMEVPQIRGYGSFPAFAATYVAACEVLRTEADWRRLVRETVEDAAAAGAVWVEPAVYLPHHRDRLGPDDDVLAIAIDEATRAGAEHGVGVGFLVAADRTLHPSDSLEQAELALRFAGRGVVGFGLANDEAPEGAHSANFAEAFAMARAGGLLACPHAGELTGPDNVWQALDDLYADRIQHGVRSVEDPQLMERLAESGVCLDVCPTSNVMLSVVPSIDHHPLPALLDAGIRCSINGDDPLLFGPGLLEEYETCRNALDLTDAQLAFVARSSIECSGAPADVKATAIAGIEAWLAAPV